MDNKLLLSRKLNSRDADPSSTLTVSANGNATQTALH
jgi:hypothetical protein